MTKILIVEDDRATAGLLKTVFKMEGFTTVVCPRPENVVDVVREDEPELILMDFHLAEAESLPILRQIKADEGSKDIPVIMMSGLDRSRECKEAGADSFLIKPFRPKNLLAEVQSVLGKRKNE